MAAVCNADTSTEFHFEGEKSRNSEDASLFSGNIFIHVSHSALFPYLIPTFEKSLKIKNAGPVAK